MAAVPLEGARVLRFAKVPSWVAFRHITCLHLTGFPPDTFYLRTGATKDQLLCLPQRGQGSPRQLTDPLPHRHLLFYEALYVIRCQEKHFTDELWQSRICKVTILS